MDEAYINELWKLGTNIPSLQKRIAGMISKDSSDPDPGFSIPTGDITLEIFSKDVDEDQQRSAVAFIQLVEDLRIRDLAQLLAELRPALIMKEVEGEELTKPEKTLRAIDIRALATLALVHWISYYKKGSADK